MAPSPGSWDHSLPSPSSPARSHHLPLAVGAGFWGPRGQAAWGEAASSWPRFETAAKRSAERCVVLQRDRGESLVRPFMEKGEWRLRDVWEGSLTGCTQWVFTLKPTDCSASIKARLVTAILPQNAQFRAARLLSSLLFCVEAQAATRSPFGVGCTRGFARGGSRGVLAAHGPAWPRGGVPLLGGAVQLSHFISAPLFPRRTARRSCPPPRSTSPWAW